MKRPDNTEMERLLRRYARRNDKTLLAGGGQSNGEHQESAAHLDADEMSAYAEGALPDAARSRYFAHLADCDSCRKLVTELTLAASRVEEGKSRVAEIKPPTSKSWRNWLATIFSPPVLRYGVPALALFAVVIVAIVATRTNRESSFVAQNDQAGRNYSTQSGAANSNVPASGAASDQVAESHQNNAAPSVAQQGQPTEVAPAATPAPLKSTSTVQNESSETSSSLPIGGKSVGNPSADDIKKAEEGEVTSRRVEELPNISPVRELPATAAPPPPATAETAIRTEAGRDREDAQKKAKVAGKDEDSAGPGFAGGAIATKSDSTNRIRAAQGRTTTTTSRPVQNAPADKPAAPKDEPELSARKERGAADEQTVGSRRFRRQGNAWIDTAYRSSLQTINVARGSEQYRALLADEPELRTITRQLGGEVIVVWKSKAYRFY